MKNGLDRHWGFYNDQDGWVVKNGNLGRCSEYMEMFGDIEGTEQAGLATYGFGLDVVEVLKELWQDVQKKEEEKKEAERLHFQRRCPNLPL
jgi:hypothetical protein